MTYLDARTKVCLGVVGLLTATLLATPPPGAAAVAPASVSVRIAERAACPWTDASQGSAQRTSQLLAAMSLDDKIALVTGIGGFGGGEVNPGAAGLIRSNERLCLPPLVLQDATAGLGDNQTQTTAFPDSIGLAATFDRGLTQRFGRVLAKEAVAKGVNVILGPGADIARTPLNGRNFEYVGEDPYLAGQAAAAVTRGIQSEPVIATVKHYALNDQETLRNLVSSDASERTMQEIHLPAFEAAVKQGDAGSVMCAYNKVNGVYACENSYLQERVLKRQWGFKGWVMSDFGATHSTAATANNGLDMEMPGGAFWGDQLKAAVTRGAVPMSRLDDAVSRIASTMFRRGIFEHPPAVSGPEVNTVNATTRESLATATEVAQQGTVLLKNQGGILPLEDRPGQRIAVIGDAATAAGAALANQGYGSGHVTLFGYHDAAAPLDAITARAARAGGVVTYASGAVLGDAVATAAAADVAVVLVNDVTIESVDRPDMTARSGTCSFVPIVPGSIFDPSTASGSCAYSPVDQDALVAAVAAANPRTVVVVQSGGPVSMPWVGRVPGIVENWLPGQVDGDALAPMLFGDVNPSGKLPVTFPVAVEDGPLRSTRQYPGVRDSSGVPRVSYSEGLLVGYRWYDAKHIAPLFPFGHGLSYTSFRYSRMRVAKIKSGYRVTARVTNTGERAGAEVAQVYVSNPRSTGEPPKQLKGFDKVDLRPGESKTVSVRLNRRSFATWSTRQHRWTVAPGRYVVRVGGSSRSLPLSATVVNPVRGTGR